jgi:exodeoxyribonuclease V alpha subunit
MFHVKQKGLSIGGVMMANNLELKGTVKRILFKKEEFHIFHLKTEGEVVTALGELVQVSVGDEIAVWGKWVAHPKFGRQLKVEGFSKYMPTSLEAIEEYLASDLVKGIGPKSAKKIVKLFGEKSLEVAQNEPERLTVIKGINLQKAKEISGSLRQALEFQKVMLELLPLGLTVKTIIKIYRQFGGNALPKLIENPYVLTSVPQIGFVKADNIARKMNVPFDSMYRIKAAIEYMLQEEAGQHGHLYLQKDYLGARVKVLLDNGEKCVALAQIDAALNLLEIEGKVIIEDEELIYWGVFHYWEREAALAVRRKLAGGNDKFDLTKVAVMLAEYQQKNKIMLADKQQEAIAMVCTNRLSIITGGPGTGKTQTVKALIDLWQDLRPNKKVVLAAPTGRAARRMKEVTGQEAVTIHRLLKLGKTDSFQDFDEGDHVRADLLVVDEFSMVDMHLFFQLMTSVDEETTLVYIGDIDQLPSVGPGNVLREVLAAGVPAVKLTEIFRQEHQSQIVVNAHRCNRGEALELKSGKDDFCFIKEEDNQQLVRKIVQIVERLVAEGHSIEDIQVLSPMKKTDVGVEALNIALQEKLNPYHPLKGQLEHKNTVYRVGDKVMQLVNNYDKEVFNGDIGIIYQIEVKDQDDQCLEVVFEDKRISCSKDELDELTLAYAITVHKSQGSEYQVVIMPVSTQHYIMLARNLIYTGITRARNKVILLGTAKALNMAIKNNKVAQRNSKLAGRIG